MYMSVAQSDGGNSSKLLLRYSSGAAFVVLLLFWQREWCQRDERRERSKVFLPYLLRSEEHYPR